MSDLTARLLAEIERREKRPQYVATDIGIERQRLALVVERLAYLAALRKIVAEHSLHESLTCTVCGFMGMTGGPFWPCITIAAVAECLGVAL